MTEGVVTVAKADLDRCFWTLAILVRARVAVSSDADGAHLVVDGEGGDGDFGAVELFQVCASGAGLGDWLPFCIASWC
jgi:hypothetical protein